MDIPAAISEEQVAAQWARLGAMFNVEPATATPDIERLLLDTARCTSRNGRLFILAASWLAHYPDYVAKRRLAMLIRNELETEFRPIMGFLLEWSQTHSKLKSHRFRDALQNCQAAPRPGPMLEVNRRNSALAELARQRASALSRKWGCWMEDFPCKEDALRPATWIGRSNPALAFRAVTGGDLVATITADAMDAAQQHQEFASEAELARRYTASRASVRAALRKLTLAGCVKQSSHGKARRIELNIWNMRSFEKPTVGESF